VAGLMRCWPKKALVSPWKHPFSYSQRETVHVFQEPVVLGSAMVVWPLETV